MVYGCFIPLTPIKASLLLKIDTFYSFIVTYIAMLQNIHQTSAKTSTIVYRLVVRSLISVDRVTVKGLNYGITVHFYNWVYSEAS